MNRLAKWFRRSGRHARAAREIRRRKRRGALREIDRLMAEYRGKIPYVDQFRKELVHPVWRSLRYARVLLRHVPGPVCFEPDQWDRDPLLNALYVDRAGMQAVLRTDEKLLRFFSDTGAKQAFALLQSVRREKTITGTRRDGEIVRRGVLQKAVIFEDHRMRALSGRLETTRDEACHLLLDLLFRRAMKRIEDLRAWKIELDRQHDRMELLMRPTKDTADASPEPGEETEERRRLEAMQLHDAIEEKLADIGTALDEPGDYLDMLETVLLRPQDGLSAKQIDLQLSLLGIRLDTDAAEPANRFSIAEFSEGDGKRWTAVWVHIPRLAVIDG